MLPNELLSSLDLETLQEYINEYANFYDPNKQCSSTSHLLRYWNENKSNYLFQLLGENLIVEKDYYYEVDHEIIIPQLEELRKLPFYKSFIAKFPVQECIKDLVNSAEYLISNTYSGPTIVLIDPTGEPLKIETGCHTSKILGKIAQAFKIEGYEDFRMLHSQILNRKLTRGKLTLSIAPIDFLTASDNNCGWHTCLSWGVDRRTGEYRFGTVEMMNSSCVLVAYLQSETPMLLPNGQKCSNKKWREFFVVDERIILGIKGYPYEDDDIEYTCAKWIKELAEKNLGWSFKRLYQPVPKGIKITTKIMYGDLPNDISRKNCYLATPMLDDVNFKLNYSGPLVCMCCGEEIWYEDVSDSSLVYCDDCGEPYKTCSNCSDRIYEGEDSYKLINGDAICRHCFKEWNYCFDPIAQAYYCDDEAEIVFIADGDEIVTDSDWGIDYLLVHSSTATSESIIKISPNGIYYVEYNDLPWYAREEIAVPENYQTRTPIAEFDY